MRASDPLSELGLAVGVLQRVEDRTWRRVLRGLATERGVREPPPVELHRVVVDRRRQWRQWRNLRHNAVLCSAARAATSPWRWLRPRPAQVAS